MGQTTNLLRSCRLLLQRWRPRVVVTSRCRQGRTSGEKHPKRAAARKQRDRREPPRRARRPLHEVRTTHEEAINNHRSAGGAALRRTCVPARVGLQTTRAEEEEDAKLLGPQKTIQPKLCTQTKEGGKTDTCLISEQRGRSSTAHSACPQPETNNGAATITTDEAQKRPIHQKHLSCLLPRSKTTRGSHSPYSAFK